MPGLWTDQAGLTGTLDLAFAKGIGGKGLTYNYTPVVNDPPVITDDLFTISLPLSPGQLIGEIDNSGGKADWVHILSVTPPVGAGYFSVDNLGAIRVLSGSGVTRRRYRVRIEAGNIAGTGQATITIRVV